MEYYVIPSLFNKEHTNHTFYYELLKRQKDEKWLEEGLKSEYIDINHQDKDGNTFLINCLKAGKFQSVEWLIKHGADITIKNKDRKAAIHIAIEKNSLPVVKGLLELGKIDVNERDIDGRTLLQNVIVFGNHKMAKLLIHNGTEINNKDIHERNVLYDALSFGDVNFLRYLLEMEELERNYLDEYGKSLMQHPEVLKNKQIAITLIEHGVDPTLLPETGESYLLTKILQADEEAIEILKSAVANNVNIDAQTQSGHTLLMVVISTIADLHNKDEIKRKALFQLAEEMLYHGGDIHTINHHETGIFHAVEKRDTELLSFLLKAKIDPNMQNEHGDTILFDVIYDGTKSLNLIKLFIKYGIDPNIKNKDGHCVYELLNDIILHLFGTKKIAEKGILEKIDPKGDYIYIIQELLKNDTKRDHNYLDSTGNPLFFQPLLYNHHQLFRLYINNKFDIHAKNHSNHNIFFEYILNVFKTNDSSPQACKDFESSLSSLISFKVNQNYQDALGWTALHKIISDHGNETLFNILIKIVAFDYRKRDNLGRTPLHNAVWSNSKFVIKKIHSIEPSVINIPDGYNILPITYAALLGNQELVLLFLELGSNISTDDNIAPSAIKKFTPMLKNLAKLNHNIKNLSDKLHIETLIDQVEKDFKGE